VLFLDDDVAPAPDLLRAAEYTIRAASGAAGFVGAVRFPRAESVRTACVALAGVLFFWGIADRWTEEDGDVPWGVTACLGARRTHDGVQFDAAFPKTGGGEDIDFCRRKRAATLARGGRGFVPAPEIRATHPWWNGGRPAFARFFMWSVGDGALIGMYPDLTYRDAAPNSAELLLLAVGGALVALAWGDVHLALRCAAFAACVVAANVVHDLYRHLWRDAARAQDLDTSVCGARWVVAVVLSAVLRMYSEAGRTAGVLRRGELSSLGKRFEWFAWRWGEGPMKEERRNSAQRFALAVSIFVALSAWDV
jgi:hypothetical protein